MTTRKVSGVLILVSWLASGLFAAAALGQSNATLGPAPDVTLRTEKGELRLSQQKGKVLVLYFSFPG